MSTITLIRHGQANTHAKDEASYDKLSELGTQQATWLGDHFRANDAYFERVYCGTLTRHLETAQAMNADAYSPIVQDPRLNEMQVFHMAQLLEAQQGLPLPNVREGFASYLPMLMAKWEADEIRDVPESYATFQSRAQEVIAEINDGPGPALIVTSGGFIAQVMSQVLSLSTEKFAQTGVAIMNSSVHQLHNIAGTLMMTQFNAVPHLDRADRQFAQTHL